MKRVKLRLQRDLQRLRKKQRENQKEIDSSIKLQELILLYGPKWQFLKGYWYLFTINFAQLLPNEKIIN